MVSYWNALFSGVLAAVAVLSPSVLRTLLPEGPWQWAWMPLLGVGVMGLFLRPGDREEFHSDRRALPGTERAGQGIGDFLAEIHDATSVSGPLYWIARGALSLLLALFGGTVGSEASAVEFAQSLLARLRSPRARWSENRRRSDSAVAIAAGVAAAFQAPLAAVLLTIEFGFGGRVLVAAVAAYTASVLVQAGFAHLPIPNLPSEVLDVSPLFAGARLSAPSTWLVVCASAALLGLFGGFWIRATAFFERSFGTVARGKWSLRLWIGAAGLTLVFLALPEIHIPHPQLLEWLLWSHNTVQETLILALGLIVSLVWLGYGMGTTGTLWPVFVVGIFLGWLLQSAGGALFRVGDGYFPAAIALVGGASLFSSIFRTPFSAAFLAVEASRQPDLLPVAALGSLTAYLVSRQVSRQSWVTARLAEGGLALVQGRNLDVLKAIRVSEALDPDLVTIHEREPYPELLRRIREGKHPFVAVVDSQGRYLGLLSLDQILDAEGASRSLETRDLLGRTDGADGGALRVDETLDATLFRFNDIPCLPVIDVEGRPLGLLFPHRVRSAYEGEVERRAIRQKAPSRPIG